MQHQSPQAQRLYGAQYARGDFAAIGHQNRIERPIPHHSATGRNPLGASVYIVDGSEDAGEVMNGREQR